MASHNERVKVFLSVVMTVTDEFGKRPPQKVHIDVQETSRTRAWKRAEEVVMAPQKSGQ